MVWFTSLCRATMSASVVASILSPTAVQSFSCLPTPSKRSAFVGRSSPFQDQKRWKLYSDVSPSDSSDDDGDFMVSEEETAMPETPAEDLSKDRRMSLKQELLQLCASYDRGYGASPSARRKVDGLVSQLKSLNPTPSNAAQGIDGGSFGEEVPLQGIWRMVWTTALDVLNLGANPVAAPGAIYQKIDPPLAINIIDFIPRIQTLLPSNVLPSSLLRAEVQTRTSSRSQSSNRVGLVFESVKLEPVEVLGFAKPDFLPPLSVQFPQLNLSDLNLPGLDPENSPGYFDVVYLDANMLIIQQNEPGGYFVSVKVQNCDP